MHKIVSGLETKIAIVLVVAEFVILWHVLHQGVQVGKIALVHRPSNKDDFIKHAAIFGEVSLERQRMINKGIIILALKSTYLQVAIQYGHSFRPPVEHHCHDRNVGWLFEGLEALIGDV